MKLFKNFFALLKPITKDKIFQTSFIIFLTYLISSFFGFIFWILAAKNYSLEQVGYATVFISSMNLITLLSKFGFDQSIIKFYNSYNENEIVYTVLVTIALISFLCGILYFVFFNNIISFDINYIYFLIIFLFFLEINSVYSITNNVFLAMRKPIFFLLQNILVGSRIFILLMVTGLGALGIFYSFGFSLTISVLFSIIVFHYLNLKMGSFSKKFIIESFNFSFGNYVSGLFILAPTYILPLVILQVLGAKNAGLFYITFTIISIIYILPTSLSTGLFVEANRRKDLKISFINCLKINYIILSPLILILLVFGKQILSFIGPQYLESIYLYNVMLFSSLFVSFWQISLAILRIKNNIIQLISLSFTLFALLLISSYIFMIYFGLNGIGYAWIISFSVVTISTGFFFKKIL